MLFTSIKEKPEPQFYLLSDHSPTRLFPGMQLVVRAPRSRLPAIQKAIGDLLRAEFPGAAPTLATMAHEMEPEYRPWRLGATLFTLFGVLALLVASIGIHSTVSYAVSQRTHEFGVRIALGAQTRDVLRQVLSEGLTTVAAGVVLGILMALAAGRIVASLLYDVGARDPMALSLVAALLLVVAAIAAFRPAWRASRADPVAALRAD
jgi:ABC-type antimicrobial peptide transport system permease subunit